MTLNGIIRGSVIELEGPTEFQDGQLVRVELLEILPRPEDPTVEGPRLSVAEVQRQLKGTAKWFCDPTDPMIPVDDWDALK